MLRRVLLGKIHRATVTGADLNYMGSISIDAELMAAAGILPWEWVQVVDVDNGARLETYAIPAPAGTGMVQLNGAAARLAQPGDKIIIMAYGLLEREELLGHRPAAVFVDDHNRLVEVRYLEPATAHQNASPEEAPGR